MFHSVIKRSKHSALVGKTAISFDAARGRDLALALGCRIRPISTQASKKDIEYFRGLFHANAEAA